LHPRLNFVVVNFVWFTFSTGRSRTLVLHTKGGTQGALFASLFFCIHHLAHANHTLAPQRLGIAVTATTVGSLVQSILNCTFCCALQWNIDAALDRPSSVAIVLACSAPIVKRSVIKHHQNVLFFTVPMNQLCCHTCTAATPDVPLPRPFLHPTIIHCNSTVFRNKCNAPTHLCFHTPLPELPRDGEQHKRIVHQPNASERACAVELDSCLP
jgi:hypothetical protein